MTGERLGGLTRLYVWSVVLEPMLFFVVFDNSVFGVTGNIARLLQSLVVAGLVARGLLRTFAARAVLRPRRRVPPWFVRYYVWYFLLAIAAGVIGASSGAYRLGQGLPTPYFRPVFEYLIAAYYFWYFAILPRTLLRTTAAVEYMFTIFRTMFLLSFVAGVADFASSIMLKIDLLPRHIADWRMIGQRFHGLAGEPRHAFVYLFLGLAMWHLRAWYRGERVSRWWTAAIVSAAILTQSASGFLGILAFLALLAVYTLRRISLRRAWQLGVAVVVAGGLTYLAATSSVRLMAYRASAAGLWVALEQGKSLPGPLESQRDSIYPIYDLLTKLRHGELVPVLIGSGFGSGAAVNSRLSPNPDSQGNPNSQMVRSLYESGIVGTVLFVLAFTVPVHRLSQPLGMRDRHRFMTLMLLLLGCCFGFRSAAPFIFLGALVVTVWPVDNRGRVPAHG